MKRLALLFAALAAYAGLAFGAVNINSATKEMLEALDGIGPVKAQAIIDYRKKNGPFKRLDEIKNVDGIGDATFEKIRRDIALTGTSTMPKPAATPAPAPKADAKPAPAPKAETKPAPKAETKAAPKADEKKAKADEKKAADKAKADEKKAKADEKKAADKAKADEKKAKADDKKKADAKKDEDKKK